MFELDFWDLLPKIPTVLVQRQPDPADSRLREKKQKKKKPQADCKTHFNNFSSI